MFGKKYNEVKKIAQEKEDKKEVNDDYFTLHIF
jgi:hypothetical protein